MKPEIKIEPQFYKGWELFYNESHDRQSDWQATKRAKMVFANSPERLIREIDETEKVTVRFKKPIRAMFKDPYGHQLRPVAIHSVVQDRVYFKNQDGTEGVCFLNDTRPDGKKENPFIHDNVANKKVLAKHGKLLNKIRFMKAMGDELLKRLQPVTDADILIEANNSK